MDMNQLQKDFNTNLKIELSQAKKELSEIKGHYEDIILKKDEEIGKLKIQHKNLSAELQNQKKMYLEVQSRLEKIETSQNKIHSHQQAETNLVLQKFLSKLGIEYSVTQN